MAESHNSPVHTLALIVGIVVLSVSIFFASWPSKSNSVTQKTTQDVPEVNASVREICYLHYRMFQAYPTGDPQTFFEFLGLDFSGPPFVQTNWYHIQNDHYVQAQDAINGAWSRRKSNLMDQDAAYVGAPEKLLNQEGVLARVAEVLQNPDIAGAYVKLVMPTLAGKGGDKQIDALKALCGEHWRNPFEARASGGD